MFERCEHALHVSTPYEFLVDANKYLQLKLERMRDQLKCAISACLYCPKKAKSMFIPFGCTILRVLSVHGIFHADEETKVSKCPRKYCLIAL